METSDPVAEFDNIARTLKSFADHWDSDEALTRSVAELVEAANSVGKASSGSWLGYQANVYFENLKPPPPGNHFSSEWGRLQVPEGWQEFNPDEVVRVIHASLSKAGLSLDATKKMAEDGRSLFQRCHEEMLSILEAVASERASDTFLQRLLKEASDSALHSASDLVHYLQPKGQFMSRDQLAISQGVWTPPHIRVLGEAFALGDPTKACRQLALTATRVASYLARVDRQRARSDSVGTNVFLGHGGSPLWRELKDFIQERLNLPWDEFNRVPVAGVTNIARLSEMLDAAAIAFLIMTAEDEQRDGTMHARMNVIHEAGLFQGRLGFDKAIVLVEEGCQEFSNIQGLGQIRFPVGNIRAAFEEVRQVLEREGVTS